MVKKSYRLDSDRATRLFGTIGAVMFADPLRADDAACTTLTVEDAVALALLTRVVTDTLNLDHASVAAAAAALQPQLRADAVARIAAIGGNLRAIRKCQDTHTQTLRAEVAKRRQGSVHLSVEPGAIQIQMPAPVPVERVTTIERDARQLIERTRTVDVPVDAAAERETGS